jgi:hypothetical protein
MDYVTGMNLLFCVIILILGIKKYKETGVKAFIFVGLGFTMFGISHTVTLMGYAGTLKAALVAVRSVGYILVIIGMLV